MADNNTVTQSIKGLINVAEESKNNRPSASQSDLDNIPRRLRDLQSRLSVLRAKEETLITKLKRHMNDLQLEGQRADTLQKTGLVQEYTIIYQDPDPDFGAVYVKNKLLNSHPSLNTQRKNLQKVSHEIKEVNSLITRFNRQMEKTQKVLAEKNSPTRDELKRDQIWNRTVSEILMLKHIHQAYKTKSRDLKGNEAYTEDDKVVSELNALQLKFTAFAERNPWVVNGRIVLDLSNPGSETNGVELRALIASLRGIGYNDKLDRVTEKYVLEMRKTINDPYQSKRLRRTEDLQLTPKPGDSLKQATSDFAHFLELTASSDWYTNLSLKNQAQAAERWFRRKTSRLFNKPYCEPEPPTDEETRRLEQEAANLETQIKAIEDFQKRAARADEPTGVITVDMMNLFAGKSDEVVDEFLKNPYRLSGGVMLNGVKYGVGVDFRESAAQAYDSATTRALAVYGSQEEDRSYEVSSPPLTGVMVIATESVQ